jgi:putative transposase
MDYVDFNPVEHGLVAAPADWPYSTFGSCVERALYPRDWLGSGVQDISAGEPGG